MNKVAKLTLFIFLVAGSHGLLLNDLQAKQKIDIEEHLGKQLPMNAVFFDANGKKVVLKDIVNKTTVLAFVYYKCPGICSPLMSELANIVNESDLSAREGL